MLDVDFGMTIQDVFSITGRGMVVVGNLQSGVLRAGETVGVWAGEELVATAPAWIEMVGKHVPGRICLLLQGVGKDVLAAGQTVRSPVPT